MANGAGIGKRLWAAFRAFGITMRFSGPDTFTVNSSFAVRCAMHPSDALVVSPGAGADVVAIQAFNRALPAPAIIVLTPDLARVLAAAILNSADDADGTTRLNFVPPAVKGEAPPEQRAGAAS
jgi:hypothetical protein